MGFFDKLKNLFKKEEDDDIIKQIEANKKKLEKSVNYNFTNGILKEIIKHPKFNLDQYFNNDEESRKLVLMCLTAVNSAKKIKIPDEFLMMPIHFVNNKTNKAIIIEVPNNKLECECNFVGIVQSKDNKIGYYTNEYYQDLNQYSLCLFSGDIRFSLNDKPQTYEEFKEAILKFKPIKTQGEN